MRTDDHHTSPCPPLPAFSGCPSPRPTVSPRSPCLAFPLTPNLPAGDGMEIQRSPFFSAPGKQDRGRRFSFDQVSGLWGDAQPKNRSVSLENLDPEGIERMLDGPFGGRKGRDPRRAPITYYAQDLGSLLSLTEEEVGSDSEHFSLLEEQSAQLHGYSASAPTLCATLTKSQSLSAIPHSHPHHHGASVYSLLEGSTQGVDAGSGLGSAFQESRGRRETLGGKQGEHEVKTGSPLGRTLSFLRKMAGNHKNKEKERMKEREKEAREREARYSNGHLFTSLTVSGTTLCSACNKSITAKEALSCPTCNVTIHNRCRDTLPNCAKMKQRQQKLGLVRNSSALPNVALRAKTPMMKERPSSAIYPSDLRQSLLGTRRGRSGLSLSKSVSTNNIAGNLNDDSPLGLRRILSQSTDSLNFRNRAMSMESLNDEGELYYASMLEEVEREGRDFEADSWSLAVDSSYLQNHRKDVIKQQDVIYELIQTELHHVRTLRIMDGVFRRGMLEEVNVEPGVVHGIFPCLDRLLALHSRFLAQLLLRKNHSLAPGSSNNFTIHQLGDVLQDQFSGQSADEMRTVYAEFCSRHPKALKLYKELMARDKRFQYFIRRVSRGPLLRRHGIQECTLLVTQRITKYPVLVQRILDNTKGSEEEVSSLSQALVLIRELLSSVDQQVLELERTHRLEEIRARLDPRAETEVRGGGLFRGSELLRRRLIHEGTLLLKGGSSRLKGWRAIEYVQVLLMTDILVFLQEKDQKFIFPCLDKPAVLSLVNLIVRDIANQERGMFLISDSCPPEMYEIHTASKDDRHTWMRLIQQTVSSCPSREDFPLIETEDKALIRRLRADIQQKDREVLELLQERVTLFSDLAEVTGSQEVTLPANCRNIFRAETPQAPLGEKLLMDAIVEVDRLSELLIGANIDDTLCCDSIYERNHTGAPVSNGEEVSVNGMHDINSPDAKDRNGNQLQDRPLNEMVCQRLVNLSAQLHALQAAVIRQDSILELCLRETSVPTSNSTAPATVSSTPAKLCRSLSRDAGLDAGPAGALGELTLLQRQHSLLQEELVRLRAAECKLKDSEKARAQLEKQVKDMRASNVAAPVDNAGNAASEQGRGGEGDSSTVAPLASQESEDQLDGLQESSDIDENSDDEEDIRISPRSESPRDLQDIPEESECGADPRETDVDPEICRS
ncbi:rho guanine nucleotide exchange factor 2-like isoform X2 [Brienomyrus brachyistius]|uniref:rho guanine nucleotide exchange factor 2-like isoform X2 n=1 Tax=Brienomyrus brachyistius TaxID=42636 RepID=UPI0020B2D891|nr:rho guanine nucleotide exchange factor 2-like isoform X2 [Brienomyrus brachyistius]